MHIYISAEKSASKEIIYIIILLVWTVLFFPLCNSMTSCRSSTMQLHNWTFCQIRFAAILWETVRIYTFWGQVSGNFQKENTTNIHHVSSSTKFALITMKAVLKLFHPAARTSHWQNLLPMYNSSCRTLRFLFLSEFVLHAVCVT